MPMKKSILASLIVYPLLAIGAFCLFFFINLSSENCMIIIIWL